LRLELQRVGGPRLNRNTIDRHGNRIRHRYEWRGQYGGEHRWPFLEHGQQRRFFGRLEHRLEQHHQ